MTQPAPQPVPEFVVVQHLMKFSTIVAVRKLDGLTARPLASEIKLAAMEHERPVAFAMVEKCFTDAEYEGAIDAEIIDGH